MEMAISSWYRRFRRKKLLLFALFAVVGSVITVLYIASTASVVPKKVQDNVPFSIYYPKSLPSGYRLDQDSFRLAEEGVVLFSVSYGEGNDIVFSEQQQPSSGEMDKFVNSYIPLNTPLELPLGHAKVGAYGSAPNIRTAVSLPVQDGPWIIATAPSDMSRDDLIKILEYLGK